MISSVLHILSMERGGDSGNDGSVTTLAVLILIRCGLCLKRYKIITWNSWGCKICTNAAWIAKMHAVVDEYYYTQFEELFCTLLCIIQSIPHKSAQHKSFDWKIHRINQNIKTAEGNLRKFITFLLSPSRFLARASSFKFVP